MYKLFFLCAIAASAASPDHAAWTEAPEMPTIQTILSNLEKTTPNSTCHRDFKHYVRNIGSDEKWANQMLDSMEKVPYGLLYGRTAYMGSFDECIFADQGNFTGKHCMVDIIIGQPQDGMFPASMLSRAYPTTYNFGLRLSYGICLPSTCTASDIEAALGDFGLKEFNVTVMVDEKDCWTRDPITLSSEEWIVIGFLVLVGIIAVSSTVYDVMYRDDANRSQLYASFSLYSNSQQLVAIYNGPGNIGCLHGIRSLTMCWIILCHEYVMGIFAPMLNGAAVLPDFMISKQKIPLNNGFVAVDTFFLLSGLLVTLVFFRNVSKTGSYDVPVAMIHRFIRLTPAFAAMVLIQSMLFYKIGKGPVWNKTIGAGVEACKDSWWSGLLYIQNIVKPTSSCLGQSWYLSSDMQMFWLSPLLLYPLLLWRVKGLIVVFLALVTALLINFFVSLEYELGPLLFLSLSPRQFDTDYVQTHMRMTPYIVGMALGFLICGMKAKKIRIKLPLICVVFGWLMSAGLCLGSMYGVVYFMDHIYLESFVKSSSYLTFHRLGWSLGIAWVIFACTAGYGGPVDYILSWSGFQIIGKISYCMFLVHFSVQLARLGMFQTNFYAHDFFFVSNFLSTLFFTVMLSIPLYLFFEAPFSNLDRYFLRNLKILPYPKKKEQKEEP